MFPLEIYIHIPFCVKKCAYCDFLSAPSTEEERERYVNLLCEEIAASSVRAKEYEVVTVFFGGGTPSILKGEQIERILKVLRERFAIAENAEITLEMNPGTVTGEKLEIYKRAGINRLSIGLQSVHNGELKMLGRIHTYEEFLESYHMAREAGFDNMNVDLISAIPGQTVESWKRTLSTILELQPEHISAYSLILEPGTPFYELYAKENDKAEKLLPDEDAERQMYRQTIVMLKEAGYERYEISNYSRPGYECRHNLGYWNRVPYLGFGIGAASLVPQEMSVKGKMCRYSNPDNIEEYQKCFLDKFEGEPLEREDEMEEFMFLGLRKTSGVLKGQFRSCFQTGIEEVYGGQLEKLKNFRLIEENEERIWLTERGIDVSNMVFVEFMF